MSVFSNKIIDAVEKTFKIANSYNQIMTADNLFQDTLEIKFEKQIYLLKLIKFMD